MLMSGLGARLVTYDFLISPHMHVVYLWHIPLIALQFHLVPNSISKLCMTSTPKRTASPSPLSYD